MANFQAKVSAVLDSATFEAQIANLTKSREVKITAKSDSFDKSIDRLSKSSKTVDVNINAKNVDKEAERIKKQIEKATNTEIKSSTLSNNMEAWLNKNTEAAKIYGDTIKELQNQLNGNTDTSKLQRISLEFAKIKSEAQAAGLVTNTFSQSLKNFGLQALGLTSGIAAFRKVVRTVSQGVSEVTKLDDSLVDLKKTTTMSNNDLADFYYDANEQAKKLGVTTQQIIQSAADWSRMSYGSKEDATRMAGLASQFAAISPGMSVDDATTGLVSVMKAFGIQTDQVLDGVMSKINIVGNNFSTTNEEIVQGLQKSAASFAVVGGTLEENIALFTAGQEVIQNASQVGNALRTNLCPYVQKCA